MTDVMMDNFKAQREQKKKTGSKSAGLVHEDVSMVTSVYGENFPIDMDL